MTEDELKEIEARAAESAGGSWATVTDPATSADRALVVQTGDSTLIRVTRPGEPLSFTALRRTADFIAHAREDVPALVAEVRRLRALGRQLLAAADKADEALGPEAAAVFAVFEPIQERAIREAFGASGPKREGADG